MVVQRSLALAFMLLIQNSAYCGEENRFSPNSLRERLGQSEQNKKSAEERLKAAAMERTMGRFVDDDDLTYELPNGRYVQGMLLPNFQKAPAIRTHEGLTPACVTKDFQLIPGFYKDRTETIECDISASQLAVIDIQEPKITDQRREEINRYGEGSEVIRNAQGNIIQVRDEQGRIIEIRDSNGNIIESTKANKYSKPADEDIVKQDDVQVVTVNTEPKVNKYGGDNSVTDKPKSSYSPRPEKRVASNQYVPPPRNSNEVKSKAGAIVHETLNYGIVRGTWIEARINRQVSSSESGDIEIEITSPVVGRFRTLPAGSIAFATKGFNSGNRRLEGQTNALLLPNGEELDGVRALIFDTSKIAGLSGTIERNLDDATKRSATKSILSAAKNIIPSTTSIEGQVLSDIAQDTLSNEEQLIETDTSMNIVVNAQDVLLKVVETF